MHRSALGSLVVVALLSAALAGCGPRTGSVPPEEGARPTVPPWFGTAPADHSVAAANLEALMPTIRERAATRGWGPRALPADARLGKPMILHSYSRTPAAIFWASVESTVTGYAVPLLDSGGHTIGVVLLSGEPGSLAVQDVGYLQWEALPNSRSLYRDVADLVVRERALLGPKAVIRVADNQGAAAVLGSSDTTVAFAYAEGRGPRGNLILEDLQPGTIVTGAAALQAAQASSHEPPPTRFP